MNDRLVYDIDYQCRVIAWCGFSLGILIFIMGLISLWPY